MNTRILITATIITLALAAPKHENRPKIGIINGNEVKESIPYQVFIEADTNAMTLRNCGGTLISQRYILTAARCVNGVILIEVILGSSKEFSIPSNNNWIAIKLWGAEIKIHENFHINSNTAINDIAVVKLPITLDLTEFVQVVKLPSRADINKDYVGDIGRISGRGKTSADQDEYFIAPNLMQADVQVVNNEVCDQVFPNLRDSTLCSVGINATEACSGDFGGPLVLDDVQIGIISLAVDACLPEKPMVFTKIANYLDWIEDHTDVVIQ